MNAPETAPAQATAAMAEELHETLRSAQRRGRLGIAGWVAGGCALVALLTWMSWPEPKSIDWETHRIDRGNLTLSATATGNLAPKREVAVGAEISGLITAVLVAENDPVRKGQVLARFDTTELAVNLEQAKARLALANASVAENRATLEESRLAERRAEEVVERGLGSAADLDIARAALDRAVARLTYAQASVREAEAAVSVAETRLSKAVITAPIDGLVLERDVEPGNTVAASFQTPELFLLAEDLERMELRIALDEADIALVAAGQKATFTVDAWPDDSFDAEVLKVHLYPKVENNVVTYTTVLSAANPDGRLKPGMTATATIITGERQQVLRVPNRALRFTPPTVKEAGGIRLGPPGVHNSEQTTVGNTLWILDQGQPRRLLVRTGRTDGRYTELLGDALSAGDSVLIGQRADDGRG